MPEVTKEKMKSKKIFSLVAVLVLSIAIVGFVSPVFAQHPVDQWIRFYGVITGYSGGDEIEIKKDDGGSWTSIGTDTLDAGGNYNIPSSGYTLVGGRNDTYRMYIKGVQVTEKFINDWTDEGTYLGAKKWSNEWNYTKPGPSPPIQMPEYNPIGLLAFIGLSSVVLAVVMLRKRE